MNKYYHIKISTKKPDKVLNIQIKQILNNYLTHSKVQYAEILKKIGYHVILWENKFYIPYVNQDEINQKVIQSDLEKLLEKSFFRNVNFKFEEIPEEEMLDLLKKP